VELPHKRLGWSIYEFFELLTARCNTLPPKRVQNVASDLLGVEALSWSVSPPQRSLVSPL
jgi:hypothetical protein